MCDHIKTCLYKLHLKLFDLKVCTRFDSTNSSNKTTTITTAKVSYGKTYLNR